MSEIAQERLEINPQLWVDRLLSATEGHVGALRIVLSALDDGSYVERVAPRRQAGFVGWVLVNLPPPEVLAKEERRKSVLAISRSFVDFVDTMIAIQNLIASPPVVTRTIRGLEEVNAYLREVIEDETRRVGWDKTLTVPRKIERFPSLEPMMKETFRAMFQIRNALEHHKCIAQANMSFPTQRLRLLKNETTEIDESNTIFEAGESMHAVIRDQTKEIHAGEEIDLSEEEIEQLVRHITLFLVPQLARKQ